MAKVLLRLNSDLIQEQQHESGPMYNLIRVDVAKKTKVLKDAFHDRLQAFTVRHGALN